MKFIIFETNVLTSLGALEAGHKFWKKFKKYLSKFTALGPHLRDIYSRLYWMNSGIVRKFDPKTKKKKDKETLKSNSLLNQLSLHNDLETLDDQLCHYFIQGGQNEDMN